MPYIIPNRRHEIVGCDDIENVGELNYMITQMIHNYIENKGLCYTNLNGVIGVLECAKAELLRQVIAPFEDKKKAENGAVSELDSKTLEDVR